MVSIACKTAATSGDEARLAADKAKIKEPARRRRAEAGIRAAVQRHHERLWSAYEDRRSSRRQPST
jgi:hypothetical protein